MKTRASTSTFLLLLLLISVGYLFQSCEILQQAQGIHALSKCKFRLESVNKLELAGVGIQNKDSFSDLSLSEAGQITRAFISGPLVLSFNLDVEAKNPNEREASLNKFEWILFIDDLEMTRGTTNKFVSIPSNNGTGILPLSINFDLKQALSGENRDALLNFGFNLAGIGNRPSRITVKAKPTVYVAGRGIDYPGWIRIENEFTSGGNGGSDAPGVKTIRR